MSTRSSIALIQDGKIKSIYVHSDGYPSYMKVLLDKSYNTIKSVEEILAQGDCSILESTIAESRFYNTWRGEDTKALTWNSTAEWLEWASASGCEYSYLFDGSEWEVVA
jgi:hypothetical protein